MAGDPDHALENDNGGKTTLSSPVGPLDLQQTVTVSQERGGVSDEVPGTVEMPQAALANGESAIRQGHASERADEESTTEGERSRAEHDADVQEVDYGSQKLHLGEPSDETESGKVSDHHAVAPSDAVPTKDDAEPVEPEQLSVAPREDQM
jgi:hypothetical protein